jgi:hypothetical protein
MLVSLFLQDTDILEAQNTLHDYSTLSAQTARKQSTLRSDRKSFNELGAIRALTKMAVRWRGITPIRQKKSRKILSVWTWSPREVGIPNIETAA